MIKITYTIFPRADLTREQARIRWMKDHGNLMCKHALTLRIARYVQTPNLDDPSEVKMAFVRGLEPARPLGMAEIYWASREDLEFGLGDPAARRAYRELVEDEKRFAAWTTSSPWLGDEHEIIGLGDAR